MYVPKEKRPKALVRILYGICLQSAIEYCHFTDRERLILCPESGIIKIGFLNKPEQTLRGWYENTNDSLITLWGTLLAR